MGGTKSSGLIKHRQSAGQSVVGKGKEKEKVLTVQAVQQYLNENINNMGNERASVSAMARDIEQHFSGLGYDVDATKGFVESKGKKIKIIKTKTGHWTAQ